MIQSKLNAEDFPDLEFRFDQVKYIGSLIEFREELRNCRRIYSNENVPDRAPYRAIVAAIDTQINEVNKEIQGVNDWVLENAQNHAISMFCGDTGLNNQKDYYEGVPIYAPLQTGNKRGQNLHRNNITPQSR